MKSMLITSMLLAMVLVSGCGHRLRPDPTLPSIAADYSQLELYGNPSKCHSDLDNNLVCNVERGSNILDLGLELQTYYNGTYRLFSNNCQINRVSRYSNSEKIDILSPVAITDNCVIGVVMSPEYPGEKNQDLRIESFLGYIVIRVTNGEAWVGSTVKVTGNWTYQKSIPVGAVSEARVIVDGCGVFENQIYPVINESITLQLDRLVSKVDQVDCTINGAVVTPEYEDLLFTIFVDKYKISIPNNERRFVPLAIPSVRVVGNKLKVVGADSVSIISLDELYVIDRTAELPFNPNANHILRLITISGRLVIGKYYPVVGWIWIQ